jgi:hypothetical protein
MISLRLTLNDGGSKPGLAHFREMLRFVSFALHILFVGGGAERFSEGASENRFCFRRRVS